MGDSGADGGVFITSQQQRAKMKSEFTDNKGNGGNFSPPL